MICGMVRNYDRETTTCSGALPKIRQRSEIEDCGQDGVCKLSPGCNRHWPRLARELKRLRAACVSHILVNGETWPKCALCKRAWPSGSAPNHAPDCAA
jgi:hypothetical protein